MLQLVEYPLPLDLARRAPFVLQIPMFAEIVGFGEDHARRLCVWAVAPFDPVDSRETHFCIVQAGDTFSDAYFYVARHPRGLATLHLLQRRA